MNLGASIESNVVLALAPFHPMHHKEHHVGFKNFRPKGGPITLPNFNGSKQYTIPPISYELGLELRAYQEKLNEVMEVINKNAEAAKEAREKKEDPPTPTPLPEYEFEDDEGPTPENMLGKKVLNLMKKNNEPEELVDVATQTVWVDFLYGREAAEQFWNSGGDPKALAQALYGNGSNPLLGTLTDTAKENTTKQQGSTNGTTSQTKSSNKSKNTTKNTNKNKKRSPSHTGRS